MTPRLDLAKVIAGAFLVPWWHRKAFARALAVPLALMVAFTVFWYQVVPDLPQYALWLAWAFYGALFSLFAVICHRLVLLDAETVARRWAPRWSWRETRFFLWIVKLYVIALAAIWLFMLVFVNLWMWFVGDLGQWTEWMLYLMKIPAIYVFGRLCLLFPATAVDAPAPTLRWSWDLTRRNGWRLMIIVGGLPFVISCAIDLIYRNEATTVEWLILAVVAVALLAVEIAAVSLSYRELTRDEPQLSTTATT
jgi:hypothetical protein